MINILVLLDDINKLQSLKKSFNNSDKYKYNFFYQIDQAFEYIRINKVDVAIISSDFCIKEDINLPETVFDSNPDVKFAFVYSGKDIDAVIKHYNLYNHSKLISDKNFDYDCIQSIILSFEKLILNELDYNNEINVFRDREIVYKKKLMEISSILNSRLACYRNVIGLYILSAEALCGHSNFYKDKLSEYYNDLFYTYLEVFLDRSVNFEIFYSNLIKRNSSSKCSLIINLNNTKDLEILESAAFLITMVCNFYGEFSSSYKGKVELSHDGESIITDIIYDFSGKSFNIEFIDYINKMFKEIAENFCDKTMITSRSGISQYRFVLKGNSANTGR